MTDKYSLDLAFSSTTLQGFDADPSILAVGYGWTKSVSGGDWKEDGQKTQAVQPGAIFYFTLYDCQPAAYSDGPPSVTSFEINFKTGSGNLPTPFVDQMGNPIIENPIRVTGAFPFNTEFQGSTGCNVKGFPCLVPPLPPTSNDFYTVNPNIEDPIEYECQVKFTVQLTDGTSKTFKVDPRMIVGGPG